MITRLKNFAGRFPGLAYALAAVGGLIYAWQTWSLAHSLTTMILDESMYIYKGYLFVTGEYAAYQDYGPLTNHMPLAFVVPGFIQSVFGPGMETARVFAFIVGLVMLAGYWLAVYRLGGKWWAALVVWIMALNPVWQEAFSQGLTQGMVNALIAWGLVFLLGENRKTWQLSLSAGLLALAVMTRINILPVFGLVLAYIFWQHGWRKGLAAAAAGALVGFGVAAFFWPGILKFLAGWIPEGLLGFVEPYRSPWSQQHVPDGFSYFPISIWPKDLSSFQWGGIRAFFEAVNFNLIPFLVVTGTLVFWPRRDAWPNKYRSRLSVFLVAAWLVMAGMHAWVALSGRSCAFFCLSGYFTFFNFLALLLLPAAGAFWRKKLPVWRVVLGLIALFGIIAAALYPAGLRPQRVYERWYRFLQTRIPRISDGRILWGERGPLLSLLEAKLNLSYRFLVEELPELLYWLVLALLVFGLTAFLYWILKKRFQLKASWSWTAFVIFLVSGMVLNPTPLFQAGSAVLACQDNVVESHEQVAQELQSLIAPDSLLYWDLTSNMLLLYLPGVEIFPPQLNTNFNFVLQSEPEESDEIYRFGYWNQTLKQEWLEQADYLIIPGQSIEGWEEGIAAGIWQQVGMTAPYESCRPRETTVYVLRHGVADE